MAVDDSYTKALLHFDGDDASTTFTDESGKVWTARADAQLDTAQKVFGAASGLFDGALDSIDTPDHVDFNLGSGAFTVDFRWRPNSLDGQQVFFGQKNIADSARMIFDYYSGDLRFQVVSAGEEVLLNVTKAASVSLATWYHVALVRNGNDFKIFLNGVQCGTTVTDTITIPDYDGVFNIAYGPGAEAYLSAQKDEFRWSKGIARWTTNFTPPIEAYSNEILGSFTDGVGLADTVEGMSLSDAISEGVGLADTFVALSLSDAIADGVGLADTMDVFSLSEEITEGVGLADTYAAEIYIPTVLIQTLPLLTCEAEGTVQSGSLEQDLPMITISAHGVQGEVGHLNVTLPKLQLSASGSCSLEGVEGDLIADLPGITISASGLCGQVGNIDQLLPQFTISATGYTKVMGDADLDLPMFYIYASGHQTAAAVVAADYLVLAMNPKNMAVSEYDWSGFNSFVYFNGVYLGAKAGTIHVLGGDDDSGSIIESEIELGQIPVDLVKPRDVYVLGRADGMMALTVQADEDTEKEVKVAYMLETLNLDRAKIPRGLQPTYFSLKLENQNGSDFDIDEIQVWGEIIGR